MKNKILVSISSLLLITGFANAGKIGSDCKFKGKVLKGKVQIVTSSPDFKVKIVNAFQDLKVEKVSAFPNKCGKWQIVTAFPDFKVQIVNSFEDFTIKYVTAFPGVK